MKQLYLRFVALTCVPVNIVMAIVMTAYAHYKWQAPISDCLRMWYHANMRTIFFGIGYSKKEREHKEALETIVATFLKERGLQ